MALALTHYMEDDLNGLPLAGMPWQQAGSLATGNTATRWRRQRSCMPLDRQQRVPSRVMGMGTLLRSTHFQRSSSRSSSWTSSMPSDSRSGSFQGRRRPGLQHRMCRMRHQPDCLPQPLKIWEVCTRLAALQQSRSGLYAHVPALAELAPRRHWVQLYLRQKQAAALEGSTSSDLCQGRNLCLTSELHMILTVNLSWALSAMLIS